MENLFVCLFFIRQIKEMVEFVVFLKSRSQKSFDLIHNEVFCEAFCSTRSKPGVFLRMHQQMLERLNGL